MKQETIEEFLKRGGSIKKLAALPPPEKWYQPKFKKFALKKKKAKQ